MSHPEDDKADLEPTFAEGYKIQPKKTVDAYANLDAGDESLARWKASLGIGAAGPTGSQSGPNVVVESLFLKSPTLPPGKTIEIGLTDPAAVASLKTNPITIKEGVEYSVGIKFRVNRDVITGLRYLHVVKTKGIKVDKLEEMIGSFGPKADLYSTDFTSEQSPSGMMARAGTYHVTSRVLDDDKEIYANFEWSFKLAKSW